MSILSKVIYTFNAAAAAAAAAAKSLQSCPTLCDPIDGIPPGSSVPGILQARILECIAISFSNACMQAKSLQSCLTLCESMDCIPPGSSVHGMFQARILEWVAISSSKGSSQPRDWTHVSCIGRWILYTEPPRKPWYVNYTSVKTQNKRPPCHIPPLRQCTHTHLPTWARRNRGSMEKKNYS